MKVKYIGHASTACTRSLAAISETGLISDRVQISHVDENWIITFIWDADTVEQDRLDEINYHCTEYSLKKVV